MNKAKAYDLPTRLTHWLFAGLFIGAYSIAKLTDDESPWFSQHMLFGLILTCVTLTRVVWGLVGSRYARFSGLPLHPKSLITYFKEILTASGKRYFGHNPASAWATVAMIALALGLGATGYQMATGQKEAFEDIHELMANAFAFVVVAHIAGLILHTLRHRDGIAGSMFHGNKELTSDAPALKQTHPIPAMIMAGVIGLFAFQLYKNYDAQLSTTRLFGVTLQLGESEYSSEGGSHQNDSDHDDDDH